MRKPTIVCHCDWSKTAKKRWLAKALLGSDGRYIAYAPERVAPPGALLSGLQAQSGSRGSVFVGFDFAIGVPVNYAERVGAATFRDFLFKLGEDHWKEFFDVCDLPDQISVYRPFYPNRSKKGCLRQHLFDAHGVTSMESLLRLCERGGDGQRQACSLFWTLGGNQVGKAALCGWKEVLIPALTNDSVGLWPFDGALESLLTEKQVVIAETYPAECYGWFSGSTLSKRDIDSRRKFGISLVSWAAASQVGIEATLAEQIRNGFPVGKDDAFDAIVGLFGMVQACSGMRSVREPKGDALTVEGWILGREDK